MPPKHEKKTVYLNNDIFKLSIENGEKIQWLKHLQHKPKEQTLNPRIVRVGIMVHLSH